jgi:hypothetical protein
MGGQEKNSFFSEFGLHPVLHKEFPRAISGKSFVSPSL